MSDYVDGILIWSVLIMLAACILLVSRPRGGYRKYFRECPLWHEGGERRATTQTTCKPTNGMMRPRAISRAPRTSSSTPPRAHCTKPAPHRARAGTNSAT